MEELAVGFIRGAHGTAGEVKLGSYSGELAHFTALTEVRLRCPGASEDSIRRLEIEHVRLTHREALVKFRGVDSRDAAQDLRRCEVWVPRLQAAQCGEDEYYIADLIGCELRSRGGDEEVLARVVSVWETGIGDILEVETPEGKIFNVPFREPFIGAVDTAQRQIELETPWVLA
ncbi:MAG: 16S rRNA processing protein RimM [Spirochaetes bacterium]|jgi:16S rRNA processing protein RimM|nr:16S rRNA processing protein RimM [Spirochaetota bacterium]